MRGAGKKEFVFYEFSLGKSSWRKGRGGQSSSSLGRSQTLPAAEGGPRSKTPQKPREKRSKFAFPGRETRNISYSSPKTSRGMGNNGFSSFPCAAKMERQVESGLGLQVRRLLPVPALQMTSFQQIGWNSSAGMPGSAVRVFGSVFSFGWVG